jgi:deoxyribonuclease IV
MAEDGYRTDLIFDAADEYRPEPPAPPEIPAWKDGSTRIGIHTSIAGDLAGSLDLAYGLGANALQIFSSSPRMWDRGSSRIGEADAARFRQRRRELQLGPLVIHANYLINLASPNPVLRVRSIQAFHQEIVRAVALGADFLVVHPGCGMGARVESSTAAVAQSLKQAARGVSFKDLRILLENTAGQGSSLGSRLEELKAILDLCPDLPLGVCIDTAHTFASGWSIHTEEGLSAALRDIDRVVGLDRVAVVHVNDSKTALGSRVDRHQHIGKGLIGLRAFGRILNHPQLATCAFILETPIDKPGDDKRNVAALWKLVGRVVRAKGQGVKPGRKRSVTPATVKVIVRKKARPRRK